MNRKNKFIELAYAALQIAIEERDNVPSDLAELCSDIQDDLEFALVSLGYSTKEVQQLG